MKQIFILILAALCVLAGCATPLTTAVEKRDIQEIKALLDSGANINEPGGDPAFTPLIFAIRYKYFDVAKLLIERGADVNFSSPLTYAAEAGDINMVNLLIEKGADVNFISGDGSPLVAAARQGKNAVVERLLEKGADLDAALTVCTQQSTDWLWGANYAPCVAILKSIKAKRETQVQQAAATSRDFPIKILNSRLDNRQAMWIHPLRDASRPMLTLTLSSSALSNTAKNFRGPIMQPMMPGSSPTILQRYSVIRKKTSLRS